MQIRFLHGNYYVLLKKITKSRTAASIVNEIGFGYIVSSRQASKRKLNQSIPSLVTGPETIFLSLGIQCTDNTTPVVPLRRFLVGTEIPMWGVNVECKKNCRTNNPTSHLKWKYVVACNLTFSPTHYKDSEMRLSILIWVKVDPRVPFSFVTCCDLPISLSFDLLLPTFHWFVFTLFVGIKTDAESHSIVQFFWLTRRRMSLCSSLYHYWLTCHTSWVYSSFHYCFHIHVFTRIMLEKTCALYVVT
jgi:hypothetical protein